MCKVTHTKPLDRALWVSLLVALVIFTGCSTTVLPAPDVSGDTIKGKKVVAVSEQMLGTPYRYGGDTPRGFDCSGLVRFAYRQVGIDVPHSSRMLYKQSQKVPLNKLQPGDLLFFKIDKRTVSHVGIYTEGLSFIHAPSSGKRVKISRLDSNYWSTRLAAAGRFK